MCVIQAIAALVWTETNGNRVREKMVAINLLTVAVTTTETVDDRGSHHRRPPPAASTFFFQRTIFAPLRVDPLRVLIARCVFVSFVASWLREAARRRRRAVSESRVRAHGALDAPTASTRTHRHDKYVNYCRNCGRIARIPDAVRTTPTRRGGAAAADIDAVLTENRVGDARRRLPHKSGRISARKYENATLVIGMPGMVQRI